MGASQRVGPRLTAPPAAPRSPPQPLSFLPPAERPGRLLRLGQRRFLFPTSLLVTRGPVSADARSPVVWKAAAGQPMRARDGVVAASDSGSGEPIAPIPR